MILELKYVLTIDGKYFFELIKTFTSKRFLSILQ